jgi:hypothetical protein
MYAGQGCGHGKHVRASPHPFSAATVTCAAVVKFLHGRSAAQEMHNQGNNGHNEEQVNQPTRNVKNREPHNPSH